MFGFLKKVKINMLILLIVIAGIATYLSFEGFTGSTLCDPCYDRNCKTVYTGTQARCSPNSPRALGLFDTAPSGSGSGSGSAPDEYMNQNAYNNLLAGITFRVSKDKDDGIKAFIKDAINDALADKELADKELADKDAVTKGASGSLAMDKMPAPALKPESQNCSSPATTQGADYSAGCKPFDINDYIRKDSIPCYGCTLPA